MELLKQIDETVSFNEKNIRVIGTYEEPWFVAKDICSILELPNITNAIKILPEKWRGLKLLSTFGGEQNMNIINEAGLYKLIMRSNKPVAQKFQEVVCEEILPSLRKKGEYKIQSIIDKNIKLEEEKKILEEQKIEIEKKLSDEQKIVIKTKLSLELNQKKFRHRYKFIEQGGCVYILKDAENPLNKFKIGFTDNINERLRSDRTMIPKIKVLFIMYTPFYELFEKNIKIRFEEHFQFQSHEWIILDKFDNVDFIINGYKEIDKACGFNSKIEDNLWKYNLEEPPVSFQSEEVDESTDEKEESKERKESKIRNKLKNPWLNRF